VKRLQERLHIPQVRRLLPLLDDPDSRPGELHKDVSRAAAGNSEAHQCVLDLVVFERRAEIFDVFASAYEVDCGEADIVEQESGAAASVGVEHGGLGLAELAFVVEREKHCWKSRVNRTGGNVSE
jgi:hypothetical protein